MWKECDVLYSAINTRIKNKKQKMKSIKRIETKETKTNELAQPFYMHARSIGRDDTDIT